MRPPLFAAALAALIALAGCGGGGGSNPNNGGSGVGIGVLNVYANFVAGTAGGPTGTSEVVTIKTTSGTTLQTQTVTKSTSSATPQQLTFSGLPSALLYVHATLYSGANGTGTATGSIDTTIVGGTATSLMTEMAQTVAGVQVGPANIAVTKGGTEQMVLTAQDSSGNCVFESSLPSWTTSSSALATISAQGLLTGAGAGQVTVTGGFGPTISTLPVTVTALAEGTWTIMVFMNSSNDLDTFAMPNVQQIEQIAQAPTSQTRCLIQWKLSSTVGDDIPDHPFNGTRRYQAVQNGLELVQDMGKGVDMGSVTTLQQFVSWSVKNYPAQHYMLIMWDHGNGWFFAPALPGVAPKWRGISYDYETGNHINVNQIAGAIAPNHIDILSYDACLMQMIEDADEVKSSVDYMVCSEDNTPGPGYPYNAAFSQFFTNPTGSPTTLAKGIVDGFINTYNNDATYGQTSLSHSVIDMSKIPAVATAVNAFSNALIATPTVGPVSTSVRSASLNYAAGDGYFYYDLGSIASRFAASNVSPTVTSTANAVKAAEQAAVVYSRTDGHSPDSTGLAIDFSPSNSFAGYATDYAKLQFGQGTTWGKFLGNTTLNP